MASKNALSFFFAKKRGMISQKKHVFLMTMLALLVPITTSATTTSWFNNSPRRDYRGRSLASNTLAFVAAAGRGGGSRSPNSNSEASRLYSSSSSSSSTPTKDKLSSAVVVAEEVRGPVLLPSIGTSSFDSGCVANPVVLPPSDSNNKWQMYYYGNPGTWANGTRGFLPTGYVGLAESDDGIHWARVPGKEEFGSILAPTGAGDDFDGLHLGVGDVVRVASGELHMYYFGGSFEGIALPGSPPMPPSRGLRMRIGRARSTDNGRTWERMGRVLDYDPEEGLFASWPRIVLPLAAGSDDDDNDDQQQQQPWRMLYHAFNGTRWAAFEARSCDGGETWTRDKNNGKMALGPGVSDGWDGSGVGTRAVARVGEELVMVYEAVEGTGGPFAGRHRLGLARWDDAAGSWCKDTETTGAPGGPILEPGVEPLPAWTSQVIGTPFLVPSKDGSVRLYFCAKRDSDSCMSIGLVESASGRFDPSSWKAISPTKKEDRSAE